MMEISKSTQFNTLGILFVLGIATSLFASPSPDYQRYLKHRTEKLKDNSIARYYAFDERTGCKTSNLANPEKGDLVISRNSPYGEPLIKYIQRWEKVNFCDWTEGRWPEKGALSSGESKFDTVRSHYYGPSGNQFTFEAWVRAHEAKSTYYATTLFHLGSGYKDGWRVSAKVANDCPDGKIEFRMGSPKGSVVLEGGPFSLGVWHQLAVIWNGKEMNLFIDGERKASKEFSGPYIAPGKQWTYDQFPEEDLGGFSLGADSSKVRKDKFDVDEVILYERALSADEIKNDYLAGNPDASPEEQKNRLQQVLSEKRRLDSIKLIIPSKTYGYFHRGESIPVTVSVAADALKPGAYTATAVLSDESGAKIDEIKKEVVAETGKLVSCHMDMTISRCDVYWLNIVMRDSDGNLVKQSEYPIAVTVPLPQNDQIPSSSPLGCHAAFHSSQEHTVLGNPVNRIIGYWSESEPGKYNFKVMDELVKRGAENKMKTLFCVTLKPPKWMKKKKGSKNLPADMKPVEDFLRTLVRRYKDHVPYWEIFNEPNSGHGLVNDPNRPKDYVEFLKVAYRVIKEEDPDALVLGICGCPDFMVWSKQVLEAGGAPYLDVVTFHNYGIPPLQRNRERQQVRKLREMLDSYGRKDAPIWNSESGIAQLPRVKGRPMSADHAKRIYASRVRMYQNQMTIKHFSPMTTEWLSACWQVQAALLDLMSGAEKYFTLSGPSRHGSMTDEGNAEPAWKGVAYAALSSVLMNSKKITEIPMGNDQEACALITGKDGGKTVAIFAKDKVDVTFNCRKSHQYKGMDILGNPLSFKSGPNGLLTLSISEAPVYIFDVGEEFSPVHIMRVVEAPSILENKKSFKGILKLTNPFDHSLTGEIKAIAPPNAQIDCQMRVEVKPNSSLSVPFSFKAETLRRKTYTIGFQLIENGQVLCAAEHKFFSPGTIWKVPEITKPISLDGDSKDWNEIPAQEAIGEEFLATGKPAPGVPWLPQWRGEHDLGMSIKSAWRKNDALYLLIDVTDNTVMPAVGDQKKLAFRYDCLEFFFDSREFGERGKHLTDGADQVIVVPEVEADPRKCYQWYVRRDHAMVNVEFVGKRTDKGYVLEGKLTPKSNSAFKLLAGTRFNMDFLIDDMDDQEKPRKAAIALHGGMRNSSSPEDWGRYLLEPQSPNGE